jgi:hypothetical protein
MHSRTRRRLTHLYQGRGLDDIDDETRSCGRRGSTLWVFWNKSALRADLRVFERVGCRALGCVVDRGAAYNTPLTTLRRAGLMPDCEDGTSGLRQLTLSIPC